MEVQVLSCALSENAAVFFTAAFFYALTVANSKPLSVGTAAQDRCKIGLNGFIQPATRSLDNVTMTAL